MKVGRLARDPREEAGKLGARDQCVAVGADAGEGGMVELAVKRAMADGVERHRLAPAARLGHQVVPLDASPERASAQPARFANLAQRISVPSQSPTRRPATATLTLPPPASLFSSISLVAV